MTHRKSFTEESKEVTKPLDSEWKISLIPDILSYGVFGYCSRVSAATLASASKQFDTLPLYHRAREANLKMLLDLTANPEEKNIKKAKSMIKKNYALILQKSTFTEPCGRKWKNPISPLQYVALMGDNFLVNDFLNCLPKNDLQEAAIQLKNVIDSKETDENGGYLSPFRELIKAYEEWLQQHQAKNFGKLNELWIRVGSAQRLLPIYGLQEFFSTRPFAPLPSFRAAPSRSACLLYDINYGHMRSLGIDIAMCKGSFSVALPSYEWCSSAIENGILDLAAIRHLCEVRKLELTNKIKELDGSLEIQRKVIR